MNRKRLVDIFQRLHYSKDFEDTGIRLAIVHRLLVKHKGIAWAESFPDKGATFSF
jgi:light-regulated signal transduction histidine kinase (bacteriophytochrome)